MPGLYGKFRTKLQIILANGLAMGMLKAIPLNILFRHFGQPILQAADAAAYEPT